MPPNHGNPHMSVIMHGGLLPHATLRPAKVQSGPNVDIGEIPTPSPFSLGVQQACSRFHKIKRETL